MSKKKKRTPRAITPTPPRPRALAKWQKSNNLNSVIILERAITQQIIIHHIKGQYLDLDNSRKKGAYPEACPLCGYDMKTDARASLAFTSSGNQVICVNCSESLINAGVSNQKTEF